MTKLSIVNHALRKPPRHHAITSGRPPKSMDGRRKSSSAPAPQILADAAGIRLAAQLDLTPHQLDEAQETFRGLHYSFSKRATIMPKNVAEVCSSHRFSAEPPATMAATPIFFGAGGGHHPPITTSTMAPPPQSLGAAPTPRKYGRRVRSMGTRACRAPDSDRR